MVKLPEGVNPTITDRDFTIATIAAPTVVREETAAEQATEDAAAEAPAGGEPAEEYAQPAPRPVSLAVARLLLLPGRRHPGPRHAPHTPNHSLQAASQSVRPPPLPS